MVRDYSQCSADLEVGKFRTDARPAFERSAGHNPGADADLKVSATTDRGNGRHGDLFIVAAVSDRRPSVGDRRYSSAS